MARSPAWFRYLLLFGWMALIFWSSATPDLMAVPLAQRFGLLPALLSPEAINLLELVLRKSAHLLVYATLALLARWSLESGVPETPPARRTAVAFFLALLYAVSDEYHQSFVPTRGPSPLDVLIDGTGAGAALGLWSWRRRRAAR